MWIIKCVQIKLRGITSSNDFSVIVEHCVYPFVVLCIKCNPYQKGSAVLNNFGEVKWTENNYNG